MVGLDLSLRRIGSFPFPRDGHVWLFFISFVNDKIVFLTVQKMNFVCFQNYRSFIKVVCLYLKKRYFFLFLWTIQVSRPSLVFLLNDTIVRIEFCLFSKIMFIHKNGSHLYLLQPFSSILSHLILPSPHILDNLEKSIE